MPTQELKGGRNLLNLGRSTPVPGGYHAAVLSVTCSPARAAKVMSISRLNFSHLPRTRSERRERLRECTVRLRRIEWSGVFSVTQESCG